MPPHGAEGASLNRRGSLHDFRITGRSATCSNAQSFDQRSNVIPNAATRRSVHQARGEVHAGGSAGAPLLFVGIWEERPEVIADENRFQLFVQHRS